MLTVSPFRNLPRWSQDFISGDTHKGKNNNKIKRQTEAFKHFAAHTCVIKGF